jgi:hypothetical protein
MNILTIMILFALWLYLLMQQATTLKKIGPAVTHDGA